MPVIHGKSITKPCEVAPLSRIVLIRAIGFPSRILAFFSRNLNSGRVQSTIASIGIYTTLSPTLRFPRTSWQTQKISSNLSTSKLSEFGLCSTDAIVTTGHENVDILTVLSNHTTIYKIF